jgi:hypothetical protein
MTTAIPEVGTAQQRSVPTFTTADVYAFTRELEKFHPDNRNVKAKIRQQLLPSLRYGAAGQSLRDRNPLLHIDRISHARLQFSIITLSLSGGHGERTR